MSKILVTGGSGYLGTHIVNHFSRMGEDVRIFTRSEIQESQRIDNVEVLLGDIRDLNAVERAVNGMEFVVHLVSNFRKGGSDKREAFDINVGGTENVLKASFKYGIKRLVHCSTIGVHGNVLEIPANEETPFNPGDLYQETKLNAEQKAWQFHQDTGLPLTVVRPISLMGPGDDRMLKLFRMIKKGRFIMVGNGDVYFQPAYIDDVVRGFQLCLFHEAALGEAFIIGGEEFIHLRDLVRLIADELNVQVIFRKIPLRPVLWLATLSEFIFVPLGLEPPLHRRRVSFFQNNRAFSIDKAKRLLGYQPQVSLKDGIQRTISWYEKNGWL
jgi:dihydroflavonol-4-reductase